MSDAANRLVVAFLLLVPTVAAAQADSTPADSARASARTDSTRRDSMGVDGSRPDSAPRKKPAPAPAAAGTATTASPPRALGKGECPPAVARNDADALNRFSSPTARGPVVISRRMLRDPTLRGRTTLAFEVDTLGRADSMSVKMLDGDPYLLSTARSSVALWRFRPAELQPGCPVRSRTTQTAVF